jgi:hypothetical protein
VTPDAPAVTTNDAGQPTPTLNNFARWMKCMTLADFQAANMTSAWNNIRAENNTRCAACHETGGEGFVVSLSDQRFFDVVSKEKFYALQFFTFDQMITPFKVVANELAMTAVSTGQDPHREHPRFNPAGGLAASRDFAARTQARFDAAAGNCQP